MDRLARVYAPRRPPPLLVRGACAWDRGNPCPRVLSWSPAAHPSHPARGCLAGRSCSPRGRCPQLRPCGQDARALRRPCPVADHPDGATDVRVNGATHGCCSGVSEGVIISLFMLLWQRLDFGARAWAWESDGCQRQRRRRSTGALATANRARRKWLRRRMSPAVRLAVLPSGPASGSPDHAGKPNRITKPRTFEALTETSPKTRSQRLDSRKAARVASKKEILSTRTPERPKDDVARILPIREPPRFRQSAGPAIGGGRRPRVESGAGLPRRDAAGS